MNPSTDSSQSTSHVQLASSSDASLVSKTTDTDLHAQTASKDEPIQGNDTHAEAAMSDLQGNNSLSLHVGDGHTSPHRLKEEFRCSEGESKEPKPSHLDKFDSGDGRGEDRNRVLERPHFSSTVKDRDRYRHYREYREKSRSRYGHSYRESHPFRERSTSRDRHHRDHWDRFSHHRRERHHSQRHNLEKNTTRVGIGDLWVTPIVLLDTITEMDILVTAIEGWMVAMEGCPYSEWFKSKTRISTFCQPTAWILQAETSPSADARQKLWWVQSKEKEKQRQAQASHFLLEFFCCCVLCSGFVDLFKKTKWSCIIISYKQIFEQLLHCFLIWKNLCLKLVIDHLFEWVNLKPLKNKRLIKILVKLSLWFSTYRHSEKDPSEDNEDSSSKRHKKKKKKRREDEERPHTRRDVTPRWEEHDSRARNGAEKGSHSSESLHNVHRDHMEDQQQLNGHKGA